MADKIIHSFLFGSRDISAAGRDPDGGEAQQKGRSADSGGLCMGTKVKQRSY
jgi:hypothetical protein